MAIHLINPLWDATGGSEWRTLSLFSMLAEDHDVEIWTEYTPDPELVGKYPIKQMLLLRSHPIGGTLVFVGCYFQIGRWVAYAKPKRVILVYNVIAPFQLQARLDELKSYGVEDVEIVYSSVAAEESGGIPGRVEDSPVDLTRFEVAFRPPDRFVVGRHSRDVPDKFHPDEITFISSSPDLQYRFMGATCLRKLGALPTNLEVVPAGAMSVDDYLPSIDCFYYRTHPDWYESYGRVVVEAMASGLPCVLEARHGYRTLIQSGINGFLFQEEGEAQYLLRRLAADPELRSRIGSAAAQSIRERYAENTREIIDYYSA